MSCDHTPGLNMDPSEDIKAQEIVLERIKIALRREFPGQISHSVKYAVTPKEFGDGLGNTFLHSVYANVLGKKATEFIEVEGEVEHQFTDGWWQEFKNWNMPGWFNYLFPVKRKPMVFRTKTTIKVDAQVMFPFLEDFIDSENNPYWSVNCWDPYAKIVREK